MALSSSESMEYSDQEFLDRLRNSDLAAFQSLYEKHYRGMVAYGMRMLKDLEASRDIVQDVFYYIWDKRDTLMITRSLDSYLFRSVHNACINHIKREETRNSYINEFLINVNEGTDPSDSHNGGLSYLLQKNLSQDIEEIIAGLPEQCRNIFKLSRYQGLRTKEIAEIYTISPRTVETQIYRALKVLRKKLQHHLSVVLLVLAVLFH